jgi:glycosyltransferase involved in cell wall biosynthesis
MTAKPLISVLIDTYNYAAFIPEAVESVLAQDFPAEEYEILVVDDGSTDDTREKIKKYGNRLRYIYKTNGGQASAFNAGLAAARGDIICLLDADDVWEAGKLRRVAETFRKDPRTGMVRHLMGDMNRMSNRINTARGELSLPDDGNMEDFLSRRIFAIGSSALSFKRQFLENILPIPEELRICPDEYLTSHIVFYSKVVTIRECLALRRLHASNSGLYSHNMLRAENLRNYIRTREMLDALLRKRIARTGTSFKTDVLALSEINVLRAKIILKSLTSEKIQACRLLLAWMKSGRITSFSIFKSLTMLIAIISPRLYAGLNKLYEENGLFPRIKRFFFRG